MIRKTATIIITLLLTVVLTAVGKPFTLVIDAGHGGHDAGAVGSFSKEKDINLKVALAFGRLVEQNCQDVKVIYTRKKDVFVTLDGRADIANKAKADLFISIHTNALPAGRIARGFETYTLGMHRQSDNLAVAKRENQVITYEKDYKTRYEGFDPNSSESYIMFEFIQDKNMANSVDLAKMVQKETCRLANRPDKGVHQAGFLVLRQTSMPSCLIELGFISTPDEERLLNDANTIEQMSRGIYNAFVSYRKKYDHSITTPYRTYTMADAKAEVKPEPKQETKEVKETIVASRAVEAKTEQKAEAKTEPKAEVKAEQKAEARTKAEAKVEAEAEQTKEQKSGVPVFKVQVLTSNKKLNANNSQFKGETSIECYEEKGMYKYTIGSSTDFREMSNLRKTLLAKFPQAFVIAFKDGERIDVNEARRMK